MAKPPPRTHGNGSASSRRIATRKPDASSLPTVAGRASASQVPERKNKNGPPQRSTAGHGNVGSAWGSVIYPLHRHHAGENRRRAALPRLFRRARGARAIRRSPLVPPHRNGVLPFSPRRFSRRENWVPGGAAG